MPTLSFGINQISRPLCIMVIAGNLNCSSAMGEDIRQSFCVRLERPVLSQLNELSVPSRVLQN